jgi:hypothetical protein
MNGFEQINLKLVPTARMPTKSFIVGQNYDRT